MHAAEIAAGNMHTAERKADHVGTRNSCAVGTNTEANALSSNLTPSVLGDGMIFTQATDHVTICKF